jgi:lichenan operon transcriptional antiterminator
VIIHYLHDMGAEIVDYTLITLILHIAIIVDRALNENDTNTKYNEVRIMGDLKCEPLCQEISKFVNHPLPEVEKINIESLLENIVHLKNMERHEYYLRFLDKILIEIKESYNLDIISSDEIKSNFALHMEKLENRCINRQVLKNPLLEEIKNKYSLVYDISVYLAIRFQEIMNYVINEDEIGYIALYILTALEKLPSSKLKIVIINPYAYSISKFIEHRLLDKFKNEIEIIKNYSVFDYKEIYKDSPDLILSLVRIYDYIGVPVCKINPFSNDNDFLKVSGLIEKITLEKIMQQFTVRNYFSPELFFQQISLETKDEVINFLCYKLKEQAYIGDDFIEQVRLREKMAPTSFNGKYAIPHPARKIAYKNGIAVAILKQPIQWGNHEVKMVFLFSLHSSFNQIPILYDVLLSKLEQDDSFAKMTKVKDFDEFMSIVM